MVSDNCADFLFFKMKYVSYSSLLEKYGPDPDKAGWVVLLVPAAIASQVNPGVKKTFRVQGFLNDFSVEQMSVIPIGEGDFILPVKAEIRKKTGTKQGSKITVKLAIDARELELPTDFLAALDEVPEAKECFAGYTLFVRRIYGKWIDDAKTDATKVKRIAMALNALARGLDYGGMLREERDRRKFLQG